MKTQRLANEYLAGLGLRIKLLRTYLKIDQRKLAKHLETVPSQISKIESGKSAPTLYYLLKIKELANNDDYLRENLSWDWLIDGRGRGFL